MKERVKRLYQVLEEQQLAAVLIHKPENRRYFSGFTGSTGVLVVSSTQHKLITDFRYLEQAAKQAPDFEVVKQEKSLSESLAAILNDSVSGKIGLEADFITWETLRSLTELLPKAEFVPVHLDSLRAVKDEQELKTLRRAVDIADQAFQHILNFIKPGVKEQDVALELEYTMRKLGAEKPAFDTIVASGVRSSLPHGLASAKTIEPGDFVTMDFGAVYQGYHSDITRTVVVGKASPRQRKIYDIVLTAQLAGVAAVKPGCDCREVDKVARTIIEDAGYGAYFGHGLGHGVGLVIHEEPRLSPTGKGALLPNMTVTVEPGIYIPEWGGVRIEDTVVVTSAGSEILTASSKSLIELDW